MAIVAAGYLFSDDMAFHVDVYQGDTPCALMARHCPGSIVQNAAVLDVDIPGQTIPVALANDEPVVVVGSSPRTSVFVYAEKPEENSGPHSDSEGELSSPLSAPNYARLSSADVEKSDEDKNESSGPNSVAAVSSLNTNSAHTPAELAAMAVDSLQAVSDVSNTKDDNDDLVSQNDNNNDAQCVTTSGTLATSANNEAHPPSQEAHKEAPDQDGMGEEEQVQTKFFKTRKVRNLKTKRGTRRASKPVQIELI